MTDYINVVKNWIEPELEKVFEPAYKDDITVQAACYSLYAGGKRIRPMMMYFTGKMLGATKETFEDIKYYAATLEMIHTYSLIHDDLPAMDNDDLRRGKPTCHKQFGEGIAVLAGDLLLNKAMERLLLKPLTAPQYAHASYNMARLAGIEGMIGGQSIDLESEGKEIGLDTLHELQEKKTGALIEAAITTPVLLIKGGDGKSAELDLLRRYSAHVGLAFQIQDDILDFTSSAEVLGKNTGKDERDSKSTFVTLLGLDGAKKALDEEISGCFSCLKELAGMGYDTYAYEWLTGFLGKRKN